MPPHKEPNWLVAMDWFGVCNPELTKEFIKGFGLDEVQRAEMARLNGMSELSQISTPDLHLAYGEMVGLSGPEVTEWFTSFESYDSSLMEFLSHLRGSRMKVVILSNAGSDHCANLEKMGIGNFVDAIYVSADVGSRKPEPAFFEHAMERMGSQANTTYFFDDSSGHVEAARALGIHAYEYPDYGDMSPLIRALEDDGLL